MRKKITAIALIICMALCILPTGNTVSAANPSVSASSSSVNVGDTFSVYFSYSQDNMGALEAFVSCSSNVSLISVSGANNAGTTVNNSSVATFSYVTSDGNPSSSYSATLTFKALSAGNASISITAVAADFTTYTETSGSASTSVNVNTPGGSGGSSSGGGSGSSGGGSSKPSGGGSSSTSKSSNNYIYSLSVEGFELNPAFDEDIQEYSVYVPFATETLTLNVDLDSSYASYETVNNQLIAGGVTDVLINVTAENGETRTYTLHTAREQDPNYVPSDNNYLSAIAPSAGALSPIFERSTTQYVIEVPYDVNTITFGATCEDARATYNVLGEAELHPGKDNYYYIVCTAENESSQIYTVCVRRSRYYEDYLSTSFINSIVSDIKSGNNPVTVDLTQSAIDPISAKIFKALKETPSTTLIIKTKNGTITFESEDTQYEITREWYDLTLTNSSQYSENILPGLASYYSYIGATNYKEELPGYATISFYTDLLPGMKVNVYMYDPVTSEYVKIIKNTTVSEGGVVSFDIDKGGDFVITTKDITASDYSSANRKAEGRKISNQLLTALGALLCLFIGFALGSGIFKKSLFKKGKTAKTAKTNNGEAKKQKKAKNKKPAKAVLKPETNGEASDTAVAATEPQTTEEAASDDVKPDTVNNEPADTDDEKEDDNMSFEDKLDSILNERTDNKTEE